MADLENRQNSSFLHQDKVCPRQTVNKDQEWWRQRDLQSIYPPVTCFEEIIYLFNLGREYNSIKYSNAIICKLSNLVVKFISTITLDLISHAIIRRFAKTFTSPTLHLYPSLMMIHPCWLGKLHFQIPHVVPQFIMHHPRQFSKFT